MRFDLHTHSFYSDGSHSPDFVVSRARSNGVEQLALTDHDCLDGYLEIRAQGLPEDIHVLPGVEISTLWEGQEIHVLGLCVDPDSSQLLALLQHQQRKRMERIEEFDRILVNAGITGLGGFVRELPSTSPGRTHVAHFLTGCATFGSRKKAFRALNRNGRFYVRPRWCSMNEAIDAITGAGGIAVLAHPHRYPVGNNKMLRLVKDFRSAGGEGMEIRYSNLDRETGSRLAAISLENRLWASVGSDFHSSDAHWMDIGKLEPLPDCAKKNAIWLHPRWHFPEN